LAEALRALEAGEADALIVSKLDRLSRSMLDLPGLLDRARREGWALILLDVAVDTSTASGEAMASVIGTFAHFERRRISERTREALAVKRAQGVRLGRPRQLPVKVVRRIVRERKAGRTLAEIADQLTADTVPTARGGEWRASTVHKVLKSVKLDHERDRLRSTA
jgi:DNA invertase Pin-like site-specific DNA recombinase